MVSTSDGRAARGQGTTRRTLVRGAAWTVPAVLVAGAAPIVAASAGAGVVVATGACKLPGHAHGNDKGYRLTLTASNPAGGPGDFVVAIRSFTVDGVPATNVVVTANGSCQRSCGGGPQVCVPEGGSVTFSVVGDEYGNSRGGQVRMEYVLLDAVTCEPIAGAAGSVVAQAQHPC
jgi:hypothetical protein